MKKTFKIIGISIAIVFILFFVIGIVAGPQSKKNEQTTEVQNKQDSLSQEAKQAKSNTVSSTPITTNQTEQQTEQPAEQQSNQNSVHCKIINYLPDSNCTPGAIDLRVTQENINSTICVSGYTATVRPSTSVTNKIKTERMEVYGDTDSPSNYELDHLIPLELGGSPDSVLNLFPEPYANPYGAQEKDKVENYLHKQVCDGAIALQAAQQEIRTNWVEIYNNCCKPTTQTTSTPATQPSGHTFYLSTYYTSKYYYCDTDDGWKSLSTKYLKSYSSEQELLKNYPTRTLHETCK